MTPSTTEHADRFGWWVCACVKGGDWRKGKPSTHIKMHAPTVKKCRTCGVTKAQSDAAGREANRSPR